MHDFSYILQSCLYLKFYVGFFFIWMYMNSIKSVKLKPKQELTDFNVFNGSFQICFYFIIFVNTHFIPT